MISKEAKSIMKTLLLTISIVFLLVGYADAPVFAQDAWHRLESDSKDFSIAVPPDYQVLTDKKGYATSRLVSRFPLKTRSMKVDDIKRVTAYSDGASFLIESYRTNNLPDAFEELFARAFNRQSPTDLALNSFHGKMSAKPDTVSYVMDVVVGSKDRVYRIFGAARSDKNESLKYFFSSLRLDGGAPFTLGSALEGKIKEQEVLISSLRESPFVFEKAEEKMDPPLPRDKRVMIPGVRPSPQDPNRLFIAYKPNARYTKSARENGVTGTVTLRITFGAGGRIEKIVELSDIEKELTEEVVKTARLTRFLPQQEDNKPVTVERVLQYSFSIY
jgi:TonB family protein